MVDGTLAVIDPGFKQPVRAISYTGVTLTRDNNYLLPDGSHGSPMRSCYRTQIMDVCTRRLNRPPTPTASIQEWLEEAVSTSFVPPPTRPQDTTEEANYQHSLRKDATETESSTDSWGATANVGMGGMGASGGHSESESEAFTSSEASREQKANSAYNNEVRFEAKSYCSKYQGALSPHTLLTHAAFHS